MRQAKAGGEIGKNGEFYKGGQFLPSSELTIKGSQKHTKTGKQCIAPYAWEVAPELGMEAIYARIEHNSQVVNKNDCEYVKGQGLVGAILEYSPSTLTHPKVWESKDDIPKEYNPYPERNRHADKTTWYAVDSNGAYVREAKSNDPNLDVFFSELVDKWNDGERWIYVKDDPFHWSNNQSKGELNAKDKERT